MLGIRGRELSPSFRIRGGCGVDQSEADCDKITVARLDGVGLYARLGLLGAF